MNICFVLPKVSRSPIGGYKMVFLYAERLSKFNSVEIHYINDCLPQNKYLPNTILNFICSIYLKSSNNWFKLNNKICNSYGTSRHYDYSKPDIVIATSVVTVQYCLDHFPKAKKYYFIQDFEAFSREEDYVRQTYRLGLVNIVISNWLKKIVAEESGKVPILVQNGIDTDAFTELVPFNNREKLSVCFLYHSSPIKNVKMTLDVIERLKAEFPSMKVYSFGTVPVMGSLPNYIDYTYNASEQEVISIYNKSRYFISATTKEGWGLTCLEAMSCGCCLISTDYDGIREFAVNEENSLLSPVNDEEKLYQNVKRVFQDEILAQKLIANARNKAREFSLDEAFKVFIESLKM